jgi:hypothetical protein
MSALCYMHNQGEQPPAAYLMLLPIGNTVPLCAEHCAWWRADAATEPEDKMKQPVWIRSIR